MADESKETPPPDSGETTPPDGPIAPRVEPADWEIVLDHAAHTPSAAAPPVAPRRAKWSVWARAALPLFVLILYAIVKFADRGPKRAAAEEIEQPSSISGVSPDSESVRLDSQTREFVARLETLRERDEWRTIVDAIARAQPATLRDHPVVQAFDVIGRVHLGEHTGALSLRCKNLAPRFRNDSDRRPLYEALILSQARIHLNIATKDSGACARYADFYRTAILEQSSNTTDVVDFRVRLAERYESIAQKEVEGAGKFRPDRVKLAEARTLLQHALRWVTTPDGWIQLQPISAGNASVVVNRLKVEMQEANRAFNGFASPFGGKDSGTWTGKKDDPIHDYPGGRW